MLVGILCLGMLFGLIIGLLCGIPVAFVLAGVAVIFGGLGYLLDLFLIQDFYFFPIKLFGIFQNFTLLAVPLFIFMGITLEKSGIAEDLINAVALIMRRIRGGLALALVLVGGLLAASTGIVGATVVTMGVMALPAMLQRNYSKELTTGTICAAGTLGQIIPPSIVLIILADLMNIAVANLFAAALIPGLMLVLAYLLYIFVITRLRPELAPLESEPLVNSVTNWRLLLISLLSPFLLILLVLGSILFGIASPTESAACGAVGALVLAALRRKLSWPIVRSVSEQTSSMTCMVFTLLLGAQLFSLVFRGLHGDDLLTGSILALDLHSYWIFVVVMLLIFVLGFFLDFLEICFIVVPLLAPILIRELGFNSLWLAIMFAVNLQTSFLTPPFGFALFYLKGVAPAEVTTADIYRGIVPFVVIQLAVLVVLAIFPDLVTFLPRLLFGK